MVTIWRNVQNFNIYTACRRAHQYRIGLFDTIQLTRFRSGVCHGRAAEFARPRVPGTSPGRLRRPDDAVEPLSEMLTPSRGLRTQTQGRASAMRLRTRPPAIGFRSARSGGTFSLGHAQLHEGRPESRNEIRALRRISLRPPRRLQAERVGILARLEEFPPIACCQD